MGKKDVKATYLIQTAYPEATLRAIRRGQSVGNPDILTKYETKEFLEKWEAKGKIAPAMAKDQYLVRIEWPERIFGTEGISYFLSVLMGGQCDINIIEACRLMELELGTCERHFPGPRYGLSGIRRYLGVQDRALVGGIIKPKIGLTPTGLAGVVREMADGGCDVIKEDEILNGQAWCPMEERWPQVAEVLQKAGRPIIYLACITDDGAEVWQRARMAAKFGLAVHINLWAGLGSYLDVRGRVDVPIFFQKSGDKVWTTGPFSIAPVVLFKLVNLIGCDMGHVGMYGGYLAESVGELQDRILAMKDTVPSFSCGMKPDLAKKVVGVFGKDVMVTSGGWIHGQKEGIAKAVGQLRRAVSEMADKPDAGGLVYRGVSA